MKQHTTFRGRKRYRTPLFDPVALICAVLAIVTLAAYWPVLGADFVDYDDHAYVTENPNVNKGLSLNAVAWAFTTFDFSGTGIGHWMPISWFSHMLDCQLYGLDPAGHHLTNLLFHIANTLLLFWVLKNMTGTIWPSAFVATLFAIHPLHVESVAWVTERRDMLSLFFWILTMAAYNRYARQPNVSKYLLVVLAFTLSLMSKSMSVTLPFVLLLLDYWPLSRFQFNKENTKQALRLIIEKIPLFILSAVSCIITFFASKHALPEVSLPLSYRISNAVTSYLTYIIKMIYPKDLAVLYPNLGISPPVWKVSVSFVILILISAAVVYWAKKKRFLIVGWLWYLGTLVPVIGLVQIGPQAMADKYTYLPLTGLFIIVAWAVGDLCRRRPTYRFVSGVVAMLLLAGMFAGTRHQLGYWTDSITLFRRAVEVTENNHMMHNNLGVALKENNQLDEAIVHYRRAIQMVPSYAEAHSNLGNALAKEGQPDEAISHYRRALQIDPDLAEAHSNLGVALVKGGQLDEAIGHYRRAVQINPDYAEAHSNLGVALAKRGQLDEAITHYRRVVELQPEYLPGLNNLAWILATAADPMVRNPAEAVRLAEKACELTGHENAPTLDTLAVAYASADRFDEAVTTAEKALKQAEAAGDENLVREIRDHLKLFKEGQSYIEKPVAEDGTPGK